MQRQRDAGDVCALCDDGVVLVSRGSGSDDHVCPPWFGSRPIVPSQVGLNDINGGSLNVACRRPVKLVAQAMNGSPITFCNSFAVGSRVTKRVISAGKAFRQGIRQVIDPIGQSSYIERDGVRVPLHLVRNSWYVKVRFADGDVNPVEATVPMPPRDAGSSTPQVEAEDAGASAPPGSAMDAGNSAPGSAMDAGATAPARPGHEEPRQAVAPVLNENSPVEHMIARLEELRAPYYGTKAAKWARILKMDTERAKEEELKKLLDERQRRRREHGEAYVPMPLPVPSPPTGLERFTHELTHMPVAPWREFCQLGKGKDRPHRSRTAEDRERGPPEVQLDFMFLDSAWRTCELCDAWITILTVVDDDTSTPLCVALPTKGPQLEYTTESIVQYLKRLGHTAIVLMSDGEMSAKQLCDKVLTARLLLRTIVRHTPRYSPASLGKTGAAQQHVQGQIRTLKAEVEAKYGFKLTPDHNVWPRLCRHAGWTIEHFHVKSNGHTPFKDAFGHFYKGDLAPFGETILYRHSFSKSGRKPGNLRQMKADLRFDRGIFLGKTHESDEYIVGTADYGVLFVRAIKRLEPSRAADKTLMTTFAGVPWDKRMGRKSKRAVPTIPLPPMGADVATGPTTTAPPVPDAGTSALSTSLDAGATAPATSSGPNPVAALDAGTSAPSPQSPPTIVLDTPTLDAGSSAPSPKREMPDAGGSAPGEGNDAPMHDADDRSAKKARFDVGAISKRDLIVDDLGENTMAEHDADWWSDDDDELDK